MPLPSFIQQELVRFVKAFFRSLGMQVSRIPPHAHQLQERPVGWMSCFLEDIKLRKFEPLSILDVGANRGDWSRMAAANFPNASFVLVEPLQEMSTYLQQFCQDFPKARYVEAGAGAEEGELTLTISDDLSGSSFLPTANTPTPADKRLKSRRVKIITLDSLYDGKTDLPALVKLDIQGFELEALKGAQKLFGQTELFIMEVSLFEFGPKQPVFSEIVGFMARVGYEVYDLPGFLRRPLDGALGQTDIAFARRDGFLRSSNKW
jgi:FkbM family methyltransferase